MQYRKFFLTTGVCLLGTATFILFTRNHEAEPLTRELKAASSAKMTSNNPELHASPAGTEKKRIQKRSDCPIFVPGPGPASSFSVPVSNSGAAAPAQPPASKNADAEPSGAETATGGGLDPQVLRQITDLQLEKETRAPVERRLSSNLLLAVNRAAGKAEKSADSIDPHLAQDDSGRVLVDLVGDITPELNEAVVSSGGLLVNSFPEYQRLRAWVPLERMEALASRPDVESIRPAIRSQTHVGKITSQGDTAHSAGTARSLFNVSGAGVKIGILSDSVDHLSESQNSGELGPVQVISGQAGSGTGEGTAMLEIVHDLAPAASLYFATADGGPAAFANNIKSLRNVGCDIIVDDVGYLDESPFQDGIIAREVNKVTASGALYFSSAGNSGNKQSSNSGTWEGDFKNGGSYSGGGSYHSFGTQNYNTVTAARTESYAALFWNDPLGHSSNDYDLYVLDSTGKWVVGKSDDYQHGSTDPFEFVDQVQTGERIVVVLSSGAPRFLHLDTGESELSVSTTGNVRGHPCAADAFCVAAVSVQSAANGPFLGGVANPLENFSSDGPRRMFYDSNGNLLTPGNLTSTGGIIRKKPDLTAADGVSTSVTGFNPFYGTSAAAPHAAAIAALLKSANPTATPTQIRAALVGSALRVAVSGPDNASGAGIVMGPAALKLILNLAAAKTNTPPILSLRSSAGILKLQASGTSGAQYQLESSDNLATWSSGPIVTNPPLGSIEFEEPLTNRKSFYRLRQITPP